MMKHALLALLLALPLTPAPAQPPQTPAEVRQAIDQLLDQLVGLVPPTPAPPPPVPLIVPVATPDALDAALAAAAPGATILIEPTLVYPTALTLTTAVTLQSTTAGASRMTRDEPAPSFRGGIAIPGTRVTLVGLEVRHPDPQRTIVDITGDHVTLDRMRVLGDPTTGGRHGIAGNGGDLTVRRSWVDDCFRTYPGDDAQAFISWNSTGPIVLEDNYFAGGSETVMFGGADPVDAAHVPSDITIHGNTITKHPAWQTQAIGVKNTLEFKNARRVTVTDNDITQSWGGHGQDGYLLMLTPRNQGGKAPYSTVEDVVVTANRFAHAAAAIALLGGDNVQPSQRLARIAIHDNAFTDLDPTLYTGSPRMILLSRGPSDVTITANTFAGVHATSVVYFADATPKAEALVITDNHWPQTRYGVFGSGATVGQAWALFVASGTLSGNVVTP